MFQTCRTTGMAPVSWVDSDATLNVSMIEVTMDQSEYCYVLLMANPKDEYQLCTIDGKRSIRVPECSRMKDERACVIARLGTEGWEAFAEGQTYDLWFKRRKR